MLNTEKIDKAIRLVNESEAKYKAENGRYGSLQELYKKGYCK